MEKQSFEQNPEIDTNLEIGSPKERFLRIKYPLSEEGELLKNKIISGEEIEESEIPTVENPRPELFKELELEEGEKEKYFGIKLSNIQVTKGCTHQCDFCAAGAEKNLKVMPFPAIVKIAEVKRQEEEKIKENIQNIEKLFIECKNYIKKETGLTVNEIKQKYGFLGIGNEIYKKAVDIYNKQPFKEKIKEFFPGILSTYEDNELPSFFYNNSIISKLKLKYIYHYYDSDVFDYKDRTFLHDDGTPADFGDVARLFASEIRPIHITTAGWSKTDKIAQKAAEKLVSLGKNFFEKNRFSINQTEVRAKKNLDIYFEDILNTIETLAPLGLEVLIFDNHEDTKYSEFCLKIKKAIEKIDPGLVRVTNSTISAYSGHSKDEKHSNDHGDVMACMPGIHIWPDGTVAEQKNDIYFSVLKGTRPEPTGKVLWK
jgi:hypothetical protein